MKRKKVFLHLLSILMPVIFGCQDYSIGETNPIIVINPDIIDFGYVANGSDKQAVVTISNFGSSNLSIRDISFRKESLNYSFTDIDRNIPPGDYEEMDITFKPVTNTFTIEYIDFLSNDPENPVATITLVGNIPLPKTFILNENYDNTITMIEFLLPSDYLQTSVVGDNMGKIYSGFALGRFNGDNLVDFISGQSEVPSTLYLFTATNAGSFIQEELHIDNMSDKKIRTSNLYNADSFADLLASGIDPIYEGGTSNDYGVYLLTGNGDGTFEAPEKVIDLEDICPTDFIIWPEVSADVSKDWIPDITFACTDKQSWSEIYTFRNRGDGSFEDPVLSSSLSFPISILLPTNVDADTNYDMDLIVGFSDTGDPGQGYYLRGDGSMVFEPPREIFDLNPEIESGTSSYGYATSAGYITLYPQEDSEADNYDLVIGWYSEAGWVVSFFVRKSDGFFEESTYKVEGLDTAIIKVKELSRETEGS